MKTTLKPRLGPQDSNSPAVISPPAEQTRPTVGATAHPGTYVTPVGENGEADRGLLHNPYQDIPTAWQWMLFPGPFSADTIWNKIARATHAGELGIAAKIATNDNSGRSQVICIYTHDFTDLEDVKRVLLNLRKLGLGKKRSISYKPEIYTNLGLYAHPDFYTLSTGKEFHMPPVIYTSKGILEKK
ncbi:hypothetical protein Q9L58_003228 [Maublancomyces gigas]|uniref:DUF1917 domain-containing protein n=1 Tax=Discina gigas TaxID=1032678 RepID=A0ABR3GPS2_9PEZI